VSSSPVRRKVLIVEDEPSIRNILFVLLAGLGCDGDVANDSHQALAMIRKESFDAVLLDLRTAQLPPEEMVSRMIELRPSLVGRVLVIVGEVADPATLEALTRCAVPHMTRTRIPSELRAQLRLLRGFAPPLAESGSC
jgi:two-component system, NtrC family, response regulator PilR